MDAPDCADAWGARAALRARDLAVSRVVCRGAGGAALLDAAGPRGRVAVKAVPRGARGVDVHEALTRALRGLAHRGVNALLDAFEDAAYLYHVFEFLAGGDVYARLEERGRPFTERQALFVVRQVLGGVAYLHGRGYVHRDVKLENLVFATMCGERTQVVQLVDFDLLMRTGGEGTVWRGARRVPAEVVGTLLYFSPALAREEPHVPEESDMWAVGVVLFALLAYCMPYQAGTSDGVLQLLRDDAAAPDFAAAPWARVSTGTLRFVQDLLHRDGAMRPTAAEALARVKAIEATLAAGAAVRAAGREKRDTRVLHYSRGAVRRRGGSDVGVAPSVRTRLRRLEHFRHGETGGDGGGAGRAMRQSYDDASLRETRREASPRSYSGVYGEGERERERERERNGLRRSSSLRRLARVVSRNIRSPSRDGDGEEEDARRSTEAEAHAAATARSNYADGEDMDVAKRLKRRRKPAGADRYPETFGSDGAARHLSGGGSLRERMSRDESKHDLRALLRVPSLGRRSQDCRASSGPRSGSSGESPPRPQSVPQPVLPSVLLRRRESARELAQRESDRFDEGIDVVEGIGLGMGEVGVAAVVQKQGDSMVNSFWAPRIHIDGAHPRDLQREPVHAPAEGSTAPPSPKLPGTPPTSAVSSTHEAAQGRVKVVSASSTWATGVGGASAPMPARALRSLSAQEQAVSADAACEPRRADVSDPVLVAPRRVNEEAHGTHSSRVPFRSHMRRHRHAAAEETSPGKTSMDRGRLTRNTSGSLARRKFSIVRHRHSVDAMMGGDPSSSYAPARESRTSRLRSRVRVLMSSGHGGASDEPGDWGADAVPSGRTRGR